MCIHEKVLCFLNFWDSLKLVAPPPLLLYGDKCQPMSTHMQFRTNRFSPVLRSKAPGRFQPPSDLHTRGDFYYWTFSCCHSFVDVGLFMACDLSRLSMTKMIGELVCQCTLKDTPDANVRRVKVCSQSNQGQPIEILCMGSPCQKESSSFPNTHSNNSKVIFSTMELSQCYCLQLLIGFSLKNLLVSLYLVLAVHGNIGRESPHCD